MINASIRLIEPNPAPDGRFQQLFEATRRAIIRCSPFTGPPARKVRAVAEHRGRREPGRDRFVVERQAMAVVREGLLVSA